MRIEWRVHALRRMRWERIDLEEVREVVTEGERIEVYTDDQPYPSALLLGWPGGRPVHVVAAYEPQGPIYVITAYRPVPDRWDASYRKRRRQ